VISSFLNFATEFTIIADYYKDRLKYLSLLDHLEMDK